MDTQRREIRERRLERQRSGFLQQGEPREAGLESSSTRRREPQRFLLRKDVWYEEKTYPARKPQKIRIRGLTKAYGLGSVDMSNIELTERERAIAKEAAKLAIEEMSSEFYKKVGKTIVEKAFIFIGLLAVGFVVGKGWVIKV
jgi:hypothetical protein